MTNKICSKKVFQSLLLITKLFIKCVSVLHIVYSGPSTVVYHEDELKSIIESNSKKPSGTTELSGISFADFIAKGRKSGIFWDSHKGKYMTIESKGVEDKMFSNPDKESEHVESESSIAIEDTEDRGFHRKIKSDFVISESRINKQLKSLSDIEAYFPVCIVLPRTLYLRIDPSLEWDIREKIYLGNIPKYDGTNLGWIRCDQIPECHGARILFISGLSSLISGAGNIRKYEIGVYDRGRSDKMFCFEPENLPKLRVDALEYLTDIEVIELEGYVSKIDQVDHFTTKRVIHKNTAFSIDLHQPRRVRMAGVGKFGLVIHNRKLAKVMVMDANTVDAESHDTVTFKPYFLNKDRENGALLATEESQIEYVVECSQEKYDALAEFLGKREVNIEELLDRPVI